MNKEKWKVILLSSLGGGLEFYDFVIFAIFSSYIAKAFFPGANQLISLMETFTIFAIGYLVRPIGGVFFSHFGDRFGRKKVFAITILIMGGSSILMAFVPSASKIGISATIIFCFLRIVQGFSLGGELPGAITFICEHIKEKNGLAVGVLYMFVNSGIVLASVVQSAIFWILPINYAKIYGWRIAFLIGGFLSIISYFIRKILHETSMFKEAKQKRLSFPFIELIKKYPKNVIIGFFITGFGATIISILFLYINSYMVSILGYPQKATNKILFLGTLMFSFSILVFGMLSDYFDKRKLFICFTVIVIIFSYPFFKVLQLNNINYSLYFYVFISILCGGISGIFPCLLADIFPTEIRYTGIAFSYNMGFAILGGLTPVVSTWLINQTKCFEIPYYLLLFTGILAIITLIFQHLTKDKNIKGFMENI